MVLIDSGREGSLQERFFPCFCWVSCFVCSRLLFSLFTYVRLHFISLLIFGTIALCVVSYPVLIALNAIYLYIKSRRQSARQVCSRLEVGSSEAFETCGSHGSGFTTGCLSLDTLQASLALSRSSHHLRLSLHEQVGCRCPTTARPTTSTQPTISLEGQTKNAQRRGLILSRSSIL